MSLNWYLGRLLGRRRRAGDVEDELPSRRSNSDPGHLSSPDAREGRGPPPKYSQRPRKGEMTLDSVPMEGIRLRRRASITLPLSVGLPDGLTFTASRRQETLLQLSNHPPPPSTVPLSRNPGFLRQETDNHSRQPPPLRVQPQPPPRRPRNSPRRHRNQPESAFELSELPGSYPLETLSSPPQGGSSRRPLLPLTRNETLPPDLPQPPLWERIGGLTKIIVSWILVFVLVVAFAYGMMQVGVLVMGSWR